MTPSTSATTTTVPIHLLIDAADALCRAGRWQQATELLDATTAATPDDRARLAVAVATAALESDLRSGTQLGPPRMATAAEAVRSPGQEAAAWDLAFLELRQAYFGQLFGDDETLRFGPNGRDPDDIAELRGRAERVRDQGPDERRRGWALMYLGLILDNIAGERDLAPTYYREALACAEPTGDDHLTFEALRHLGDHDHDDGDHDRARERWERSTASAARAGLVAGTLAQQLLLAVLHRDSGDEAGAQALAQEIIRWAGAIDATFVRQQAESFAAGVDPTAAPPDVEGAS
jgi:tetratricopeptide (TPR) repeat protein